MRSRRSKLLGVSDPSPPGFALLLARLERSRVARCRPGSNLSDEDVHEAIALHRDGLSLEVVRVRFLVAHDTIGMALRRVGLGA